MKNRIVKNKNIKNDMVRIKKIVGTTCWDESHFKTAFGSFNICIKTRLKEKLSWDF